MRADPKPPELTSPRFTLFIASGSSHSLVAIANLNRALESLGKHSSEIEIIDVYDRPDLAQTLRILVTPTLLLRDNPELRVIGDLSACAHLQDFLK